MATRADAIFTNGTVRTLDGSEAVAEAVAVRDGEIVRVSSAYEIEFLEGAETTVVDLDGRVLLPGFVDAHTHMEQLGQYQVHADLTAAETLADVPRLLEADHHPDHEWILGFGYDESEWDGEQRYPRRSELDRVSTDRPVAAFRVDMHSASLNSVALDRLDERLPAAQVRTEDGEPTGVVVEKATEAVWEAIEPDQAETRELVEAAIEYAHERGVTGVHDMVRHSHAPAVYRDLDREGSLDMRVRINYWADHLEAVEELGLRPNHGSDFVRTGAIKTYTDGTIGSRTAKVKEPYEDAPQETGEWVVEPDELASIADAAAEADLQMTAHAIGDDAIRAVLDAFDGMDPAGNRHRVEHVELMDDALLERFADAGAVASVQPNFLKWADEDGLYDQRLGTDRRIQTDRFGAMCAAGIPLAFGSDCMPLDPLFGIHQAVNAPVDDQRLSVSAATKAYTLGSAYAGFDEDRMGTVEPGKVADFVVLEESPWEHPERIEDIEVAMTVVDGRVVYDGRESF